jgi:hypothetical protein
MHETSVLLLPLLAQRVGMIETGEIVFIHVFEKQSIKDSTLMMGNLYNMQNAFQDGRKSH